MDLKPVSVWLAFGFSAVLCLVVLVANVVGAFIGGGSDAGMIALICFLPMTFWFAAASHRQTREQVRALEARLRHLEAKEAG